MKKKCDVLDGCCPLGHNCFEKTGNKTNYYPGDCPDWANCSVIFDIYSEDSLEAKDKGMLDYWYYEGE